MPQWFWDAKKSWHDFLWILNAQHWALGPSAMNRDYYTKHPEDPNSAGWIKKNPTIQEATQSILKQIQDGTGGRKLEFLRKASK